MWCNGWNMPIDVACDVVFSLDEERKKVVESISIPGTSDVHWPRGNC